MNTEILATNEHPSVHGYRTIQLPRIVGKIRKREESMRNNSVHTGLENVPFQIGDHFPQITVDSHRISLFGLFRKEGRRRRAKREGGGRFHEPLGEDNLTIRAKGRCCTRRCAIRFYYGNARLVSNAVLSVEDFGSWCRVAAVFNRVQRPSAFEISQPI